MTSRLGRYGFLVCVLTSYTFGAIRFAPNALAQNAPTQTLGNAAEKFATPFSHVRAIREQSDGRVIVLDDQEFKILRVNLKNGSSEQLGRAGKGPGEYTLPFSLAGLSGDTTIVTDMSGGGRHIVITPQGVANIPLRAKGFENNNKLLFTTYIFQC